jgi:hypothetical protein
MATPQTPRARRSPLARYAPALAVVVVIAIVAVVIGLAGGGKSKKKDTTANTAPKSFSDVPIFYNEAKQANTLSKYTWQPNCDTTTGDVAIPILLPPPCVPALKGSNGGATSKGVDATTIKIGYYIPPDDPTYTPLLKAAGAYDAPDNSAQAYRDYAEIYSHVYDLYGRTVQMVRIDGSGASNDEQAAKADADKAAADGVFAVIGGPAQARSFATELAHRKILCIGACIVSAPQAFIAQNSPYIWPTGPSPEETALMTTELIKKQLVGKKAVYAGDPALKAKTRTFTLLNYDTVDGEYKASWDTFYKDLQQAGADAVGHVTYLLRQRELVSDARTIATKLKSLGATTIVFTGDPIFPSFLTTQMTEQGYFPEWVMAGTVLADTNVFARRFDKQQWSHAFGLQLIPARVPKPQQDSYTLHEWWFGTPPPTSNNYGIIKGDVELLMDGMQLAGPKLTPTTFRDGMFHAPAQPSGPHALTQIDTYGSHGFWSGTDYNGLDNAGILYWDPNVSGPDETGNVAPGMYRLVDGGRRYLPGHWPTAPVKLFDPANTVTIYKADRIPADLVPKTQPVPAGAPTSK